MKIGRTNLGILLLASLGCEPIVSQESFICPAISNDIYQKEFVIDYDNGKIRFGPDYHHRDEARRIGYQYYNEWTTAYSDPQTPSKVSWRWKKKRYSFDKQTLDLEHDGGTQECKSVDRRLRL